VTVCRRPNGLQSPTQCRLRALIAVGKVEGGQIVLVDFNSATSVPGSVPIFFARNFRRSLPNPIMISSAPETTWLAVRMYPSGLTITPEPRPCSVCLSCLCGERPPKKLAAAYHRKMDRPSARAKTVLRRRHCDDTRRDLFHQRRKRCNNSLARLLGLLRCERETDSCEHTTPRVMKARMISESSLHNGFTCKRESDAQSVSALF